MSGFRETSTARSLHRLVEHYTPDGTLGRLLLGGTALLFAPFLFFGGMTVLLSGAVLTVTLMGLLAFVSGVPAFLVGVLTLWPVYLSLIGNVASPASYPEGAAKPGKPPETAEEVLKRRYAAGELTREEFERRLGDVLDSGEVEPEKEKSAKGDEQAGFETSPSR